MLCYVMLCYVYSFFYDESFPEQINCFCPVLPGHQGQRSGILTMTQTA